MRLFIAKLLMVGLLLLSASSASAIGIFVSNVTPTTINIGETVTFELRLNADDPLINLVYVSTVTGNPSVVGFQGGTSPASILFNFSTYANIPVNAQPQEVPGDTPVGRVRAASFGAQENSGRLNPNQLLATLTFVGLAPGTTTVTPGFYPGDQVSLYTPGTGDNGTDYTNVSGSVSLPAAVSITVNAIPEPGTALLMGMGLAGLGLAGRRKA